MDKLLQLVLEADDDADLSAAVEHFYVLGPGLKKEFCAILKALKADGLVVSCSDAPKGDKDLIREKLVNMAYFSKLGVGYSHTCSEMEAVALSAERDGLDLNRKQSNTRCLNARPLRKNVRYFFRDYTRFAPSHGNWMMSTVVGWSWGTGYPERLKIRCIGILVLFRSSGWVS